VLTLSNTLSILRAPLALVFLQENVTLRLIAVFLAMITDSIDGYLARKYRSVSKFGAILDPAMDKFFVYFVLTVLFLEGHLLLWQAMAMISRDISLAIFALYLTITKKWSNYTIKAIRWGKIATAMQFLVILGLTIGFVFSWFVYGLFFVFAALALFELIQTRPSNSML
jgi:CDP-diacylglycerol--glycerol-3-phosphate 3-phosphatidyltransferase